ncbi:MAG: HAD family hydrolase [Pseudomonadota bacterium]
MTETILPHELPHALERAPAGIKLLSLDCFDTLLWRDCHLPSDVFAGLKELLPMQRSAAELNARKAEFTRRRRQEVRLKAIYQQAMPNADAGQLEAALAEEVQLEAQTCFAFAPTVELMRAAKARGLKVIIVSDTYLDARQLRELIVAAAGEEVSELIDRVFASSEAGIGKREGLLAKALKAMKCRSHEALHIGDNPVADYESSQALGVAALHLVQFGEKPHQRLRLERACQQIIGSAGSGGRASVAGLQMHRAALAKCEPSIDDPAEALGLTVLGPVFHAYDQWLRGEASKLAAQRGGTVHWLFMLRDGHLPFLVHQQAGAAQSVARVEISRFAATAAALSDQSVYDRHIGIEFGLNPSTLARQMLFTETEIAECVGKPQSDAEMVLASERLLSELRSGKRQKLTRRRARGFAERLIQHVRAAVDPQPGDTLMLVDLGYNGSAQNQIDSLLKEAFNVHLAGRYLLSREMTATGLDKAGLIDANHFDPGLLEALCGNVAVIEQLATCELGSVIDYSEGGAPIRKASGVKGRQSDIRELVQQGAIGFAKAALDQPIIREDNRHAELGWRETAASVLTRFMFLPQTSELEVLTSFEHDVNLGSERIVPLFDEEHAREGLRRRGLFYMKGSARMFLPAELAHEDINTRISLLAQKRFGLGLTYTDNSGEPLQIPAFYVGNNDSIAFPLEARATHDGYYVARLPLSPKGEAIAVQIGAGFAWVEIVSVVRSPIDTLKGGLDNDFAPRQLKAVADGLVEHTPGIFECAERTGVILIGPQGLEPCETADMVEIVLRPLRLRELSVAAPRQDQRNPMISHAVPIAGEAA